MNALNNKIENVQQNIIKYIYLNGILHYVYIVLRFCTYSTYYTIDCIFNLCIELIYIIYDEYIKYS